MFFSPCSAVAVNAKLKYSVVELFSLLEDVSPSTSNPKKRLGSVLSELQKPYVLVASDLVPTLEAKWGIQLLIKKSFLGSDLEHCKYAHPVDKRECPVVVGSDYITTESGTGLVHTAPGHGQEDYVTGLNHKLPVLSPVDDDGKFTSEAGQFCGLDVLGDGNLAVVKFLDECLSLIMEEPYKHKYPYDWRTKNPTIVKATEQWFASVEGFRQAALDAICKRTWGVPIPAFFHKESKQPLMNQETISHIKSIISQKGSDAWWYMTIEELLQEEYRNKASEYEKGTDTMDVWFDS